METDDEKRAAFLVTLSETGNISKSARVAGVPRRTLYYWRETDKEFAKEWDIAVELGTDALEDEATRRAKDGTRRPVFYQGVRCGYVREFSDTLMVTLLKARRPDKFKDRVANELSGPGGGPLVSEITIEHHTPPAAQQSPAGGSDERPTDAPVPPGPDAGLEVR